MPGLLLTAAQLATLLDEFELEPGVGSPLHGVPSNEPLPRDHPERRSLLDAGALVATDDGDRPNAAVASALCACAVPDEVLWLGAETQNASVTVCRRGRLFVDCSQRSDHRISLVFPLDRAQLVLLATAALSGERPEPPPSGFALRGPLSDLFLLRVIGDVAVERPVERNDLVGAVTSALDDRERTLAIDAYGRRSDLDALARDAGRLDEAIARLTLAGHLAGSESGDAPSARFGLSSTTAAVVNAPVRAAFGVGRRVIFSEPGGHRRLRERRLRVERRGDRLVTIQVVSIDGAPQVELVERSRAQIRSLIGVFLLGDVWERVAQDPTGAATEVD